MELNVVVVGGGGGEKGVLVVFEMFADRLLIARARKLIEKR